MARIKTRSEAAADRAEASPEISAAMFEKKLEAGTTPGRGSGIERLSSKAEVDKASEPLKAEIDKGDAESWHVSRLPKRTYEPWSAEFGRIATTMILVEPLAAYEKLERDLALNDDRTDYASVVKALDLAQTNARLAFRLFATAVRDMRSWEMKNAQLFASMRSEASAVLEREKESGVRKKMITEADVDAQCAIQFPDWTELEMRKLESKQVVKSCEDLNARWNDRARDLQVIASKLR